MGYTMQFEYRLKNTYEFDKHTSNPIEITFEKSKNQPNISNMFKMSRIIFEFPSKKHHK